jgi:UTP--glucose-1-phosphate uridylyltransferase
VEQGKDFVMEVTDKTRADIKGGTLITTKGHPLKLLEVAQVPKEHVCHFLNCFFGLLKFSYVI